MIVWYWAESLVDLKEPGRMGQTETKSEDEPICQPEAPWDACKERASVLRGKSRKAALTHEYQLKCTRPNLYSTVLKRNM